MVREEVRDGRRGCGDIDGGDGSAAADLAGVREHLGRAARVRAWLDAREITARRRLDDVREPFGATPDEELAHAGNRSRSESSRVDARSKTCAEVPQLGTALADGDVTAAHLDVLGRAMRGLDTDERQRLIADEGERLARAARRQSPDEFTRTVKETVAASRADGGVAHLETQKVPVRGGRI